MPFIPQTDTDAIAMLREIGVGSVGELFSDIPAAQRFPELALPRPLSELELMYEMEKLAGRNLTAAQKGWFLGAGVYNHFVPALVDSLSSRGEFLTAYTPYQPEVSQGTLQVMYEYQSMAAALLGVDVVNASHYDGATALAEAVILALRHTGRRRALLPDDLHPEYLEVLRTYVSAMDVELATWTGTPQQAADGMGQQDACLVVAWPGFYGTLQDLSGVADAVHRGGGLFVVHTDPLMLGLVKSPGEQGADIVTAEGQALGNPMSFGGPFLGMFGVKAPLMRKIPGRLAGQTKDSSGRRGFVLTLSAREQHIRREKAVSNICSNQGLVMLRTAIYLAAMGARGLRSTARLCWNRSHYAARRIAEINGFTVAEGTFFKEFVVKTPIPAALLVARLEEHGIIPGLALDRYFPQRANELLICVTEMNTREQIDHLIAELAEAAR